MRAARRLQVRAGEAESDKDETEEGEDAHVNGALAHNEGSQSLDTAHKTASGQCEHDETERDARSRNSREVTERHHDASDARQSNREQTLAIQGRTPAEGGDIHALIVALGVGKDVSLEVAITAAPGNPAPQVTARHTHKDVST